MQVKLKFNTIAVVAAVVLGFAGLVVTSLTNNEKKHATTQSTTRPAATQQIDDPDIKVMIPATFDKLGWRRVWSVLFERDSARINPPNPWPKIRFVVTDSDNEKYRFDATYADAEGFAIKAIPIQERVEVYVTFDPTEKRFVAVGVR